MTLQKVGLKPTVIPSLIALKMRMGASVLIWAFMVHLKPIGGFGRCDSISACECARRKGLARRIFAGN